MVIVKDVEKLKRQCSAQVKPVVIPGDSSASSPGFSLNLQVRNIGLRADKGRSVVSDANFSLSGFSVSPHFKTGPGTGPKWLNHFWNRTRPNQSGTARSSGRAAEERNFGADNDDRHVRRLPL